MLFTDFESYKIENNIIENTIIICEDKKRIANIHNHII